tara:strand:- start:572 stop:1114 length:543 start_codon:yes stop_codon:yes gene_type:complete
MEDTTLNWNDLNSETIVMDNIIKQTVSNSNNYSNSNSNIQIPNILTVTNNKITKSSIDNLLLNTNDTEKINNTESSFYDVFQGHTGGGNTNEIDYNFDTSTSMMFDINESISTITGYSLPSSQSQSQITYSLSNIDTMNSEESAQNDDLIDSSFNINFENSTSMSNLNTSDINVLSISDL